MCYNILESFLSERRKGFRWSRSKFSRTCQLPGPSARSVSSTRETTDLICWIGAISSHKTELNIGGDLRQFLWAGPNYGFYSLATTIHSKCIGPIQRIMFNWRYSRMWYKFTTPKQDLLVVKKGLKETFHRTNKCLNLHDYIWKNGNNKSTKFTARH